ncbi:MAG: EAL domain-containing protein [Sphingosinicella sp.]|nr:EAL domain-containing protein [Sphingosinicella sp.]
METPDAGLAYSVQAQAARYYSVSEGAMDEARQDYLDALPVAASVLCQNEAGRSFIDISNEIFCGAADWDPAKDPIWIDQIEFFKATGIGPALDDFLKRGEKAFQFDRQESQSISGRHYTVRLSRLRSTPYAPQRCLMSLIDKTMQVETEKNLRAEMLRDSLTGLPNRLAFNERVAAVFGDPLFKEGSHAVLVVDVTRFSRVNESVGALAGDELLITFARRLCSVLRPGDFLARTGGDEFGILIRLDRGMKDALRFADRIKAELSMPFHLSEMEICVDCSIGCALFGSHSNLPEELLRNAQFALKRAKTAGRTQLYEPDEAHAARRRFRIETDLRRAIEADQLELAFQPLIDLSTGAISGFEALARWDHEEDGHVSPTEFIPVAEESGLILPLGQWALAAALDVLADWDRQAGRKLPIYMGVNLSAVQIQRDDVSAVVAVALKKSGIEGGRLMLELTESAIVHDPERAAEVLEAMRALNVQVAMDDFGTGYTSLAYLQRLPIDLLKIDSRFVTGMLGDPDSAAIVRAILSLADALGMATAAEGVECADLAAELKRMGCTNGQGFHFSEPLGAEAALDYWMSRSA